MASLRANTAVGRKAVVVASGSELPVERQPRNIAAIITRPADLFATGKVRQPGNRATSDENLIVTAARQRRIPIRAVIPVRCRRA